MLIAFIRKWKNNLDDKDFGGAVLMDLSRAFDTLNHDLRIAKLNSYSSLDLNCSCLTYRWYRTKFNTILCNEKS